jgi:amylosucrase
MMYVDLFSGNLKNLDQRIDYLKELGVSYLHLMPLMATRDGQDDGGYAVSNYRRVQPALGTVKQLRRVARDLHHEGISLALDLVMNHTAREHRWAQKALSGDKKYRRFYFMYDDREIPNAYERTVPEVFPDFAPGNFTWVPEAGKWVWTTFYDFQWDLDFSNPSVFEAMWGEMVFLANVGADVLRLDAVPFLWKRLGTTCRNQPETVLLVAAYRALMRIFAPAVAFKAEAIVSPEEIVRYLGIGGYEGRACDIAYNATLMNHMWHALACENVHLLRSTLSRLPAIPEEATWMNYVRCHDDIGWGISDDNAAAVYQSGYETRRFCTDFYAGDLEGSYSEGYRFQVDPDSGEARISGTAAALAGLQKAVIESDESEVDLAVRRLLLLHGVSFFMRGFPLIYSGDELGQMNDYSYLGDPVKRGDNRWVHRPPMNWMKAERRNVPGTVESRLFSGLRTLVETRRGLTILNGHSAQEIVPVSNDSVFVVRRRMKDDEALLVANFSRSPQRIDLEELPATWLSGRYRDHLAESAIDFSHGDHLLLEGYEVLWLGHCQSGPGTGTVDVELRLQVETQPGEMVYASGSIPQLGQWNPDRALGPLDPSDYPVWKGVFMAHPGTVFEFAWLKKRDRKIVETERGFRIHRVNGATDR